MSPFIDERLLALLDHYLAGECTSAEVEEVRAWLSASAENRAVLADVERIRTVAHNRPPVRSSEAAWKRAVEQLELQTSRPIADIRTIPLARERADIRSWKRRLLSRAIAAGIVIAAAGGLSFIVRRPEAPVVAEDAPAHEYSTARGQRAVIELEDGSQLTLGPESHVRLAADYGKETRDLSLTGQGYFKVHHDPARRFRVHTATGIVEDIGTEFVVNAYPEMRGTQVVVAKGKVALRGTALTRGQMGRVERNGFVAVTSGVNLEPYIGWINGRLSFREARLDAAFTRLGRWYDLDVELADSKFASMPLTASFRNEPIGEVLQILDITLGMRHKVAGRTVIFYPASRVPGTSSFSHPNR